MRCYVFILFLLSGCSSVKHLNGSYKYGGTEFRFKEAPNKFQYFERGEMGLLAYSSGKWILNKNRVQLIGFNEDLKILNVESVINKNSNGDRTQILIHYTPDTNDHYIKIGVIINDNRIYTIAKDTILIPLYSVETIQVISYLSYEGLLSSQPRIDTLYSSKIKIDNSSKENKNIILSFTVNPDDFYRTGFTGTITLKNNHTLLYQNRIKLKKFVR